MHQLPASWQRRYELVAQLGQGGLGTVYRAHDRLLGRDVALKRTPDRLGLAREYDVLRRLDHPAVVRVHDALEPPERGGDRWFSMDHVDGERLDQWLRRGPPPAALRAVFVVLLDALAYVHAAGLVHGDVKPQNVVLMGHDPASDPAAERAPFPVLVDFGLSSRAGDALRGGTAHFVPPELRRQGATAIPAGDLWALARAFDGAAVEPDLRALLDRCGELDPERRPADGAAAMALLDSDWTPRLVEPVGAGSVDAFFDADVAVVEDLACASAPLVLEVAHGDAVTVADWLGDALRRRGQNVRVGSAPRPGEPALLFIRRLVNALGGSLPRVGIDAEVARDGLEAVAVAVIDALAGSGLEAELPILVVPRVASLPAADRHVLQRAVEAGSLARLVVVDDAAGFVSASGLVAAIEARPGARHRMIPAPTEASVQAWLDRLRVDEHHPDSIFRRLLVARRHAGATDLGRFAGAAVHARVLVPNGAGGWISRTDAGAHSLLEIDAPGLSDMWQSLLGPLPPDALEFLAVLHALGGTATAQELEGLRPSPGAIATLARVGLVAVASTGSMGEFVLPTPVLALLDGAPGTRAALPPLGHESSRLVDILVSAADTGPRLGRRAHAAIVAGRFREAAWAWERIASMAASALDSREAGQAYLRAAMAAESALGDAFDRVTSGPAPFALAALAVRHAEVAADRESMDQGLALARRVAGGTAGLRLLEARIALSLGNYAGVEEQLGAVLSEALDTRESAEWWLIRGSALALMGEPARAGESLREAQRLALSLGDVHLLGKISNNLGNQWLAAGRYAAAAEAYATAADAKRQTGDRRGERIAESNGAIAARARLDFASAWERATRAGELAGRLGDRRGSAMATMIRALIALDVGEVLRARAALDALDETGLVSPTMRLDAELCRVRLDLAEAGPTSDDPVRRRAQARCLAVLDAAATQGLPAARSEAAWLLVVAGGEPPAPTAISPSVSGSPLSLVDLLIEERLRAGIEPIEIAPLRAVRGLLEARAGRLGSARRALDAAAGAFLAFPERDRGVPAGTDVVIPLLREGAELAGMPELASTAHGLLASASAHRAAERLRIDGAEARAADALPVGGVPATGSAPALARDVLGEAAPPTSSDAGSAAAPPADGPPGSPLWPLTFGLEDVIMAYLTAIGADAVAVVATDPGGAGSAARRVLATASRTSAVPGAPSLPVARALAAVPPDGAAWRGVDEAGAVAVLSEPFVQSDTSERAWLVASFLPAIPAEALKAGRDSANLAALKLVVERDLAVRAATHFRELSTAAALDVARLRREHEDEVTSLREALAESRLISDLRVGFEEVVHRSAPMRRVVQTLSRVADVDVNVLLLGESGVGKELLARAVHAAGDRRTGPFVAENCGAVPADLFESVFFGHVRGAFTGALTAQRGLVEAANHGTLFLDEVAELRLDHQAKLLRVLQERKVRPVGGTRELDVDFRVLAATNRDLQAHVRAGTFREDLYYRLAVITVAVPALRERRGDIVLIAERLLERIGKRLKRELALTATAADRVVAFDWPGNVRELENELTRAAILTGPDGRIDARHLSPPLRERGGARPTPGGPVAWDGGPLLATVERVERDVILDAARRLGGKKIAIAAALGLSRPGLDARLERYGIDVSELKSARSPSSRDQQPGEEP
ncbi:MAG: sigma 54-interacting transcriptional regulator [Myxococcales bacterium]|nr:sigma 54-interacting transcriptional regulator [Myxococcales bacterium]